ncbi:NMD3 family-domain-containing protein [Jimgerdemannia flammicorona]|uniref:60S ribosomal export protein NMD3 n=1 Tax=Jimgerdemannia flammicorona TaxID=994334 RepID=A0A433DNE0_9FUNG|nr:NMD3 family-domain-containing protein [Jimgerdemannia flammicorona]
MCVNCIRNEVDITEGIPKHVTLHFCRNCERYLQPPQFWIKADLESRELLALCLKKLKGLSKVRLVDAGFIWTEPHSRRIKVKLSIQKEVFAATILQQIFEVEYTVSYQQCDECTRVAAQNTWKAMVQVRQKVEHKRTFLYLEQLILKHNAHKDTVNIKERAHAIKMCEFLNAVVPIEIKRTVGFHRHPQRHQQLQVLILGQLCLCTRVGNSIHVVDVNTLNQSDVTSPVFWRTPFSALATAKEQIEYYVLDVEPLGPVKGKHVLADVHVARSADFGRNDTTYFARSHLGGILKAGDIVLGYDMTRSNFNDDNFDALNRNALPDVILVKKTYPARRKKHKQRAWKLAQLAKEEEEMLPRKADQERIEHDYEMFLRDLEEDVELRQTVNIFKNKNILEKRENEMVVDESDMDEEEGEDFPEISLEEMMDDLKLNDGEEDEEDITV